MPEPRFRVSATTPRLFLAAIASLLLAACAPPGRLKSGMPPHVMIDPPAATPELLAGRDSVTLRATDMYRAGPLRRLFNGRKYREAWGAPVTVPVAWLDTLRGGLTPDDKGGGFQTLSLDLVGPEGCVYTIRSVNKNPEKFLRPWMRWTNVDNLVIDGIASGHPYGAQVMPGLSDAAGVRHFHPKIYFVPAQPALDSFNDDFGNRLFWLEYEPEGEGCNWVGLDGFDEFQDSDDVLEKWREDPEEHQPDLRALVRARVFDLWLGDWDRHDGQWGWAEVHVDAPESGGDGEIHRYYPIPNDRDNVFYGIGGIVPRIVASFERRLRPFGPTIDDIDGLTSNSQYFDYSFLYEVPVATFEEEARSLQAALTDEAIETAMRAWPSAVYAADGDRIVADLKTRRGDLVDYARAFHAVIRERGPVEDREEAD